jgi:hypothetical protein
MVLRRSARQGGMVLRKTGLRGPHQLRTNSHGTLSEWFARRTLEIGSDSSDDEGDS